MKKRTGICLLMAVLVLAGTISGCSEVTTGQTSGDSSLTETGQTSDESGQTTTETTVTGEINLELTGDYSDKALDPSYEESEAFYINLKQDETTATASETESSAAAAGVEISDNVITITESGTYVVTGTLTDGQLIIELSEDKNVHLVLAGAEITCETGPAVLVKSVKNLYLTLEEGTENILSDGSSYDADANEEENYNAALYSKDDLIINGTGALTVNGNYTDGITSKDDLQIISGTITVNAVDDALVGKDSISILGGTLTLAAGGDGLKSSNTEDLSKGYIVIDGGEFTISAGDDGMHSETALVINDGTIEVTGSNEGLESLNVVINGGNVSVTASDDGINVSGGNDSSSSDVPAMGMGGGMDTVIDGVLRITDGTVFVQAGGDGLDSNGNIEMTGGTVTVAGPQNAGNGVLDYNGTFEISGGVLIAYGTSGMNQAPSDSSAQVSFAVTSDTAVSAGSEVTVQDSAGSVLYTFTVTEDSNYFVISAPELIEGETYTLTAGSWSAEVQGGETASAGAEGQMFGGRGKMSGGGEAPSDGERPSGEMPSGDEMSSGGEMPGGAK